MKNFSAQCERCTHISCAFIGPFFIPDILKEATPIHFFNVFCQFSFRSGCKVRDKNVYGILTFDLQYVAILLRLLREPLVDGSAREILAGVWWGWGVSVKKGEDAVVSLTFISATVKGMYIVEFVSCRDDINVSDIQSLSIVVLLPFKEFV